MFIDKIQLIDSYIVYLQQKVRINDNKRDFRIFTRFTLVKLPNLSTFGKYQLKYWQNLLSSQQKYLAMWLMMGVVWVQCVFVGWPYTLLSFSFQEQISSFLQTDNKLLQPKEFIGLREVLLCILTSFLSNVSAYCFWHFNLCCCQQNDKYQAQMFLKTIETSEDLLNLKV